MEGEKPMEVEQATEEEKPNFKERARHHEKPDSRRRSMKILIIEDDQEIVDAVSLAFQIRWPEDNLVSTHLGEKGLEMVESENPDVVILDLGLPDISGFEVLKQTRLFSDVPILILMVRADEADIVKGLEWGADDYVVKPIRQLELLSRIKALTRRKVPLAEENPAYIRYQN